jgi:hypothetical protein
MEIGLRAESPAITSTGQRPVWSRDVACRVSTSRLQKTVETGRAPSLHNWERLSIFHH